MRNAGTVVRLPTRVVSRGQFAWPVSRGQTLTRKAGKESGIMELVLIGPGISGTDN